MTLGPKPCGSIAQSYGGSVKPSSSIRTSTFASCLAGIMQSEATTTRWHMLARFLRWTFIHQSPKVTVPVAKFHCAPCLSSQSLLSRKSSTLLQTETSASNRWPSMTKGSTVSPGTSRLALLAVKRVYCEGFKLAYGTRSAAMTDHSHPLSNRHFTGCPLISAVTYILVGYILALTVSTGFTPASSLGRFLRVAQSHCQWPSSLQNLHGCV